MPAYNLQTECNIFHKHIFCDLDGDDSIISYCLHSSILCTLFLFAYNSHAWLMAVGMVRVKMHSCLYYDDDLQLVR